LWLLTQNLTPLFHYSHQPFFFYVLGEAKNYLQLHSQQVENNCLLPPVSLISYLHFVFIIDVNIPT
jgi:hypothetical protein